MTRSPRNPAAPAAASTGTASCTVPARAAPSAGNAAYQIAYPPPEASAPEAAARPSPAAVAWALPDAASAARKRIPSGALRTKWSAVVARGSVERRPRTE